MPPDDQCPVCHSTAPIKPPQDIKVGEPLICPKCASVITRDESGDLREPLIKEMLQWDQTTNNMVTMAQDCIRKGGKLL